MVAWRSCLAAVLVRCPQRHHEIFKFCEDERLEEAVEAVERLEQRGVQVGSHVLHLLLQGCTKKKDLATGRRVRSVVARAGHESSVFLSNQLIRLFASCNCLWEANEVFLSVPKADLHTWQAIISAHAHYGRGEQAIELYMQMLETGLKPNNYIHVAALKACASTGAVAYGRAIHARVRAGGAEGNLYVGNSLVDMYSKCGHLQDAYDLFERLPRKDIVSWNTIIAACLHHGQVPKALQLLHEMQQTEVQLNRTTAVSVLKACGSIGALDEGKLIHALLLNSGLEGDVVVGTTLVGMYAKCGRLEEACDVFDKFPRRSVELWNALIGSYTQNGRAEEAFQLLLRMQQEGTQPDKITLVSILKACRTTLAANSCKDIYERLIESGVSADVDVDNALVKAYCSLGDLDKARQIFDRFLDKNLASWNGMISGYAEHGHGLAALRLFQTMEQQGVQPDKYTFISLLKACGSTPDPDLGMEMHAQIVKRGWELDVAVSNTLIGMYSKFGFVSAARDLFDRLPEKPVSTWNAMIGGYAQRGRGQEALQLFEEMQEQRLKPDKISIIGALKACASLGTLVKGKQIHARLNDGLGEIDVVIGSSLVDMYAKCGSLGEAHKLFEQLPERNVVSWNALIGGYAQHGQGEQALKLFEHMQGEGVEPNRVTFLIVLKACTSCATVAQGKEIHAQVIRHGLESDILVCNTLIDMYARFGCLDDSQKMFSDMPSRDVASWNAIIGGFAQNGRYQEALQLYEQMEQTGVEPDRITFLSVLKACKEKEQARKLHARMLEKGMIISDVLGSALVDMYVQCGSMDDAQMVFDSLPGRDVISWTAVIDGYAQHGDGQHALQLLHQMLQEGIVPDRVTFLCILRAVGSISALEHARRIHAQLMQSGVDLDVVVGNTLVDTYAKCGSLEEARRVFDELPERNIVSWNAMIAGYVQNGQAQQALVLFQQMQQIRLQPDKVTVLSVLRGCGSILALDQGKQIHAELVRTGLDSDQTIGNALLGMYVKCGVVDEARKTFDNLSSRDVVSWTCMIGGYAQQRQGEEALKLFQQMQQEGIQPDKVTYLGVLRACSSIAALDQGKEIHTQLINTGVDTDVAVGSNLLNMYVKCGSLDEARNLFAKLPEKSVAAWNALIEGCTQQGDTEEAVELFQDMQKEGLQPNQNTFLSLLKEHSSTASLNQGIMVHSHAIKSGLQSDTVVGNTLVDMYGKCGSLDEARKLFDSLFDRSVVSWNAIIGAYAQHGYGEEAINLFHQMQLEGIKPDEVTVISVLSGCSHSGLVDFGCRLFESASRDFGITMGLTHYACMVDLLSRAGHLLEAEDFIKGMPLAAETSLWMCLLGACHRFGDVDVGRRTFEAIIKVDPSIPASYVLMSNIYAAASRWDEVIDVRRRMKEAGVTKVPGRSWIESDSQLHQFLVDDKSHPERKMIYDKLDTLKHSIRDGGNDSKLYIKPLR